MAPFTSNFFGPPPPHDVAWLAVIPTTAPALTPEERTRITAIRQQADLSGDVRIRARCDQLLAA